MTDFIDRTYAYTYMHICTHKCVYMGLYYRPVYMGLYYRPLRSFNFKNTEARFEKLNTCKVHRRVTPIAISHATSLTAANIKHTQRLKKSHGFDRMVFHYTSVSC